MRIIRILVLTLAVSVFAPACGGGGDGAGDDEALANQRMYELLQEMIWESDYYNDGDWLEDYDDGQFYGAAFFVRAGEEYQRDDYRERAIGAHRYNVEVLGRALQDPLGYFQENIQHVLMALLGTIEYIAATGDVSDMDPVDRILDLINNMAKLYDDYIQEEGSDNYYISTYGPTVNTAVVALINLQYAVLLERAGEEDRVQRAREVLAKIEEVAFDGDHYQFAPGEEKLFLYPNIVMMLCHTRFYQATGEQEHLDRAEQLYTTIQALRAEGRPGYHSPYSADYMGAQTEDYSTLSSQNYTMFTLALLAQVTGKQLYRGELMEVLTFVREYLFVPADGKAYHHWIDGRNALPEDHEYFCSGCNLQLLYIIWWIEVHHE